MKKIKYIGIGIYLFLSCLLTVNAATPSASISVSSGTIENGNSVKATVKLKNTAAWNVKINCTGATSGNSSRQADASSDGKDGTRTFTLSCKSTSTGIINFTASGDMTSADGTNKAISLSKSVTVTKPREKSTNNYLSSLSVEGYEITPAFDKETNEYTVEVPATATEIKINASKADKYASLSGTGTFEVFEGSNSFDIVVTSETGVVNTYKLIVNVIDQNPINVTVEGKNYTVVKKRDNLVAPNSYEEKTITIDGVEIPAYYSSVTKYTLVGLKDEAGTISYYIYNEGKYEKYIELSNKNIVIYPLKATDIPKGYALTTIEINGEKITAYVNDSKGYVLIYGINIDTGNKGFYSYDKEEQTFQRFNPENTNLDGNFIYLIIALGIVSVLLLFLLIIVGSNSKKKTKLIKKYEELHDKKNNNKKQEKKENIIEEKKKK